MSSTTRSVASGVVLDGLTMMVLPVASAGPTLVPISVRGKFHGIMAPHTPMGWRITMPTAPFCDSGHQLAIGRIEYVVGLVRTGANGFTADQHGGHYVTPSLVVGSAYAMRSRRL